MKDELEKSGAAVYETGWKYKGRTGLLNLVKCLRNFLKVHPYEFIHVNTGTRGVLIACCLAGRLSGCRHIIAHSHNAKMNEKPAAMLSLAIRGLSTEQLACSDIAAIHGFGRTKGVHIVRNAIELENYQYDEDKRSRIRREYNISDEMLIGVTGAIGSVKNQIFMVKVLEKLLSAGIRAKLLLAGAGDEGEYAAEIKRLATQYHIEQDIIMTGFRADMGDVLSAMDIFALPSQYEGLSMATIEAQANGLKCLVSDRIPACANLTGNVCYLPIDENDEEIWAEETKKILGVKRDLNAINMVRKAHYDVKTEARKLENFYVKRACESRLKTGNNKI